MEVASLSSTGPRIFLAGERGLRAAMELVADSLAGGGAVIVPI